MLFVPFPIWVQVIPFSVYRNVRCILILSCLCFCSNAWRRSETIRSRVFPAAAPEPVSNSSLCLPVQIWSLLLIWVCCLYPEKCRFCTGTGSVAVELGGGEKEVSPCINCDGAGSLTCTTCQGSGIQPRYLDRRYELLHCYKLQRGRNMLRKAFRSLTSALNWWTDVVVVRFEQRIQRWWLKKIQPRYTSFTRKIRREDIPTFICISCSDNLLHFLLIFNEIFTTDVCFLNKHCWKFIQVFRALSHDFVSKGNI